MKIKDVEQIRSILRLTDEDVSSYLDTLDQIDGRRVRHEQDEMRTALAALRTASEHLHRVRISFEDRNNGTDG